jgi:hyaluronan synthase
VFITILMFREYVSGYGSQLYLFSLASILVWVSWLVKVILSRRYEPWTEDFFGGTSVIIPVVDEPEELFRDVLRRITEQRPSEIVVVINGKRNQVLEDICGEFPGVNCHWTPIAGKRNAIKVGVENTTHPICVLVDSDTIWTQDTLHELVKPFNDVRVGGVTTKQRILDPERSWITRWADWLENTRGLYSMPAQSVLGQIGCLPGRTIAFRREILERCMTQFMGEKFLGVFLEVSDDRTLTNYALKQGYRTVFQSTSLIYTDAPLKVRKLFKQQLRWARGSTYNTARMLPWYLGHTPVLAFFFLLDIAIPFILLGATAGWVVRSFTHEGTNFYKPLLDAYPGWMGYVVVAALIVISSTFSMWVRQSRHLAEKPGDMVRMPVFIIASTFFLMPIRILGFLRMAHAASWGTRAGAYSSKDGPTEFTPVPRQLTAKLKPGGLTADDVELLMSGTSGAAGVRIVEQVVTEQHHHQVTVDAPTPTPVRKRHRPNLLALLPYVVALGLFALMSLTWI